MPTTTSRRPHRQILVLIVAPAAAVSLLGAAPASADARPPVPAPQSSATPPAAALTLQSVPAAESGTIGFESGLLSTYSTGGSVSVVSDLGPITPPEGSQMAQLDTGPDAVNLTDPVYRQGSGIGIPIRPPKRASGTISYQWNMISSEYGPDDYPESGFRDTFASSLVTSGSPVQLQAYAITSNADFSPVDVSLPEGDSTVGQTGWRTATYTFTPEQLSGVRGLEFDIWDVGDRALTSTLLIDDIRVEWSYDCGAAGTLTRQQAAAAIGRADDVLDADSLAALREDPCAALVQAGPPTKNEEGYCDAATGKPSKSGSAICFSLRQRTSSEPFTIRTGETATIDTVFDDTIIVPVIRSAGAIRNYARPVVIKGRSKVDYAYGQSAPPNSLSEVNTLRGSTYLPGLNVTVGVLAGGFTAAGDKATGTKSFSNAGRIADDGSCKAGETCYASLTDNYAVTLVGLVNGVTHELQGTYQFGSQTQQGLAVDTWTSFE